MNPFQHIYERYVDEAAFLWVLRDIALGQPHYSPEDMRELEERIRRQLNGIMTAPEDAWLACEEALEIGEAGEVFTAGVTAFRCGHLDKIQKVAEAGVSSDEALRGLCSALDFLPGQLCHPWVKKFFGSKDLVHKELAMEACLLRSENPAAFLNKIIEREDCRARITLFASCLKVAGQFKRGDVRDALVAASQMEEDVIRFNALRARILQGEHELAKELEAFVLNIGEFQHEAIQLAFRVLPHVEARKWISTLVANEELLRPAVKAMAVLGDPQVVNWLLTRMEQPELARLCADAFVSISGLDIQEAGLIQDEAEAEETEEEEEDFVALDEDEHLPYPHVEAIRNLWQANSSRYIAGRRYFMGQEIGERILQTQLTHGYQRKRHEAALELALRKPSEPLINTRAFFRVQPPPSPY